MRGSITNLKATPTDSIIDSSEWAFLRTLSASKRLGAGVGLDDGSAEDQDRRLTFSRTVAWARVQH